MWRLGLVETMCDCVIDVVKCCGGGVIGFEAMLMSDVGYVGSDVRKDGFL